jgi:hypothetical protein
MLLLTSAQSESESDSATGTMLVRARMAGVTAGAEPEPARAFAPLPPPAGALVPTIGGGAAFCAGLTEPETGERRAAPASPLVTLPAASACLAEYGDACGLPLPSSTTP